MAGPTRARIFGVLAKIEATSGTDAAPTAATDAVSVVGIPTLTIGFVESGGRPDVQRGVMITTDRAAPAGRFGTIDLTLEVKGSGTAGTAPPADALLRGAGFSKTVSASTSVLYTTLDTAMETFTLYLYSANKLFKLVGCVASLKLAAVTPKIATMVFSVTGKMVSDPTEVALPALTLETIQPALFHSAANSIGSWTSATSGDPLMLQSAAIDLANTVAARSSAGATDGLVGYLITDRKATQTLVAEIPALATFDPFAFAKAAGSTEPVTAWQVGTAAGNILQVSTGKMALGAPKPGVTNGINTMTLDGTLGAGATGATTRELALLYT